MHALPLVVKFTVSNGESSSHYNIKHINDTNGYDDKKSAKY